MKKQLMHNVMRKIAIALLFLVSLNALAAGYSFMAEPSGKDIGISTAYLRPSAPFDDFFVPGLVLFVVVGICSSVVAVLTLRRRGHYTLLLLLQGAVWVGWIAVQLTMVTQFHLLHGIIGFAGLLLMVFGWVLHKAEPAAPYWPA